jgi:hypothetical protein
MEMAKIVEILEQAGITVRLTDKVEANFYLMVCEYFGMVLVTDKHRYRDIFLLICIRNIWNSRTPFNM